MRNIRSVGVLSVIAIALINVAVGQRPVAQAYQLTHDVKDDISISPDGSRMIFVSRFEGREQFFIANIDGTASRLITHDDADHEDPAWSPDGKRIAFTYIRGGTESIALMDLDGSGPEIISPRNTRAMHPTWSADSKKILYCTDDDLAPPRKNDSDIIIFDLVSRGSKILVTGGVNTYPNLSPDGTKIVFRRMVDVINSEVFVANADGSAPRNLTNHPAFDGWPAWSPDGKQIAFASNRNSSYQIFIMDADGSNVRLLANTEGRGTAPKWSPDGSHIYFPICRNVDFGFDCEIFAALTSGSNR